ncbi:hypothetical protein L1887_25945 [Cichorium endivia]|nr:hypothetical protein L1887_25945 [Cichorium endivia]
MDATNQDTKVKVHDCNSLLTCSTTFLRIAFNYISLPASLFVVTYLPSNLSSIVIRHTPRHHYILKKFKISLQAFKQTKKIIGGFLFFQKYFYEFRNSHARLFLKVSFSTDIFVLKLFYIRVDFGDKPEQAFIDRRLNIVTRAFRQLKNKDTSIFA